MQNKIHQNNIHFRQNLSFFFVLIALLILQGTAFARKRVSKKTTTVGYKYPEYMLNTLIYRNIGPFRGRGSIAAIGKINQLLSLCNIVI
jgi:hypothetical protein